MYSDLDSCVIIQRGLQRDPILGDDGHPRHPTTALQTSNVLLGWEK